MWQHLLIGFLSVYFSVLWKILTELLCLVLNWEIVLELTLHQTNLELSEICLPKYHYSPCATTAWHNYVLY